MDDYVQCNLVSYCDVEGSYESELYVQFAVQLDDKEAALSDHDIALAIGNIQRFAKYTPRARVTDADWWN